MTDHPITPPPKLVQQWVDAWYDAKVKHDELVGFIATQAARWGADEELEACLEWVCLETTAFAADLQAARRPNPPSLKAQALESLHHLEAGCAPNVDLLRRALEALPDD